MRFSTNKTATKVAKDYGQPAGKFWLELMPLLLKCLSERSKDKNSIANHTNRQGSFSLSAGTAEVIIVALACGVGLLCIILTLTCIYCLRSKRKEHTTYNAIEM